MEKHILRNRIKHILIDKNIRQKDLAKDMEWSLKKTERIVNNKNDSIEYRDLKKLMERFPEYKLEDMFEIIKV